MNLSISNKTAEDQTTLENTLPEYEVSTYILNIFLTGVCVIIVCCDIVAIRVMRRCKRVAYQCLQLSISYLISEMVALVLFIIHQLLIFGFRINTDFLFNSRISTVAIMHCISSAFIAAIIWERVFALMATLNYSLGVNRIKIHLIIAVIWLAHIIVVTGIVSDSFHSYCNWTSSNCDFTQVNKVAKYCFLILNAIYDVIMIIANVIVYNVARRHACEIDVITQTVAKDKPKYTERISERQYASIMVFVKIVTFYILLQLPLYLATLFATNLPEIRDETSMRMLRSFGYFCFLLKSFINLYFYILKIKECRMILFFMLGKYFPRYEQRAYAIRLEVFDIVVCSQRARSSARN